MTFVSKWIEGAGTVAGVVVGPAFAAISFARRARTFHPRGDTFLAKVAACPSDDAAIALLAARLEGVALVRMSGALSKRRREWLDVLGCAIRFRGARDEVAAASPSVATTDQDVLFATIWRPWTMAFSLFTTNARDYLANDYHAVSPFDIEGLGRGFFRLRPLLHAKADARSRRERLDMAVANNTAGFRLELRRGSIGPWSPVATVTLERAAEVADEQLRFSAFHTGRGLVPRGFVHAMRRPTYALSQRGRRLALRARP
jgi:hypothetical protein